MKIKTKKNQKPIDVDAHFKYRCPKGNCGYEHWLSLKQTKTKNFKIVCDCGCVFRPKQIFKLKIAYIKTKNNIEQPQPSNDLLKIPHETQKHCVKILCEYGFTNDESIRMLDKAFEINQTTDPKLLVKYVLQNLETLLK